MQHSITPDNLHSFCRTCLNELQTPLMHNIQRMDVQIRQWLEDSAVHNQIPLPDDAYPMFICHLCHNKLESFLEFHQMCSRSRQVFENILENALNRRLQKKCRSFNVADSNEICITKERNEEVLMNCDWLDFDFVAIPKNTAGLEMQAGKRETVENDDEESNITTENDEDCIDGGDTDEESFSSSIHVTNEDQNSEEYFQRALPLAAVRRVSSEESNAEKSSIRKRPKRTKNTKPCKTATAATQRNSKYKFRCDQCHKRCLNQQTLDTHKRIHQGLKPSQCPKCNRSFHSARYLRVHLNEFHKKIHIKCEYEGCGKEFRRTCTYRHHVRYKHVYVDKEKARPKKSQQSQHVCEECGKVYAQLYNLQVHQYSHKPKEEYPFRCPQCDKPFPCHIRLRRHELTHSDVKNYECPHCGLRKRNIYTLRAHINCHTKERKWNCPKCGMVFTSPEGLRSHDKVVHLKLRPYSCRHCEQNFATSDALKHHEMRHTGEKPHACSECGKSFIQLVALRTHMKTHNMVLAKRKTALKVVTPGEAINI